MTSGVEDEDAFHARREELIEDFAGWLRSQQVERADAGDTRQPDWQSLTPLRWDGTAGGAELIESPGETAGHQPRQGATIRGWSRSASGC